jgi:hypothetical protein
LIKPPDTNAPYLSEDSFTKLLPEHLQRISKTHFTPIRIALMATEWLTEDGKKDILDVGAGVGKFCIAGASNSDSFFYGIEHRPSLVGIAHSLIEKFQVSNALVKQQNVMETDFSAFNAFYLFNPFYEHIVVSKRLNNEVPLADALYNDYLQYTKMQLDRKGRECRIVTFHGDNREIPDGFEIVRETKERYLKLWVRR